jgi:hypothetical protein
MVLVGQPVRHCDCVAEGWHRGQYVLAPELIDRSEFIDQPAPGSLASSVAASPAGIGATDAAGPSPQASRKRAADLAKTPEGMVSGSLESERPKVQRLLQHAQELEAELEAPFDPEKAGMLVPDVITRPDKPARGGRKRFSALHGSVTMQALGDVAEQRRKEDEAVEEAKAAKKRQALEEKEAEQLVLEQCIAAFELCEAECTCGVVPCPWAG